MYGARKWRKETSCLTTNTIVVIPSMRVAKENQPRSLRSEAAKCADSPVGMTKSDGETKSFPKWNGRSYHGYPLAPTFFVSRGNKELTGGIVV